MPKCPSLLCFGGIMFGKGRRLFSIASVGLIVIAAMQAIGYFQPPATDLVTTALYAAMRSYEMDMGIASPSMQAVFDSTGFGIIVLLAWVGLLNLLIARHVAVGDRLIRTVCTLNIIGAWLLVATYVYFEVTPYAVGAGIVATLFTIARFRVRLSHPHL